MTPGLAAFDVDTPGGPVTLGLRGLDRAAWAALVLQHPSDDPRFRWDHQSLAPALVAACVLDPVLDLDLAGRLVDDVDTGDDLVQACMRLTVPGDIEWAKRMLAKDPRLAAEGAAATRIGISHAQFTAWPDASQDLALAHFELADAPTCPGCGVPEADMHREGRWEAEVRACWQCLELEGTRKDIPDAMRGHNHVRLVRTPDQPAQPAQHGVT